MNKFLKIGIISTSCNLASTLGKALICKNGNFGEAATIFTSLDELKFLGLATGTSYLVSTVPALVGYGVGSLVDNGFAKQAASLVPALALTAGAECFTDGQLIKLEAPTLDNFKLWTDRENLSIDNLKGSDEIHEIKFEIVDFANTFIQTELFNILLPDAVDAPEVA